MFKCRLCNHLSANEFDIVEHVKIDHADETDVIGNEIQLSNDIAILEQYTEEVFPTPENPLNLPVEGEET